jgi:5-methyltetrahydropteroyltriglutamate--homocysteine methyltransferase
MRTAIIGYPRIGHLRELKFATEKYFAGLISKAQLLETAALLRKIHWQKQIENGINYMPSNDFSFYDNMLDMAVLLNAIPLRYKNLELDPLDGYFAMARGYQGANGDVKALSMKKWFNTNYHYIVPEIEDDTEIFLSGSKPFDEFIEAKDQGIVTKPVITGAFTFLKLAKFTGQKTKVDFVEDIITAYVEILKKFNDLGAEWVQFDEPALVTDLSKDDINIYTKIYHEVLSVKGNCKVLLQTYFGDIRDCYEETVALPFDGIGLDFIESSNTLELLRQFGFPENKTIFAGVVNGKNIWRNNYAQTLNILDELKKSNADIVLNTSCSLLHVPYTLKNESSLPDTYKKYFSFADEKLAELEDLKKITAGKMPAETPECICNRRLFNEDRFCPNASVQAAVASLTHEDFIRHPSYFEREKIQKAVFNLPLLPTTTIGSFPQTAEVKANRSHFKNGKITLQQYIDFNKEKIAECVALQEDIGLDVLVHGEFERNDMVEYFGECLDGFLFTEKAWVQSYGTRCVKPPVIWGDISRSKPMTVDYVVYAQSLTKKYMKGMLTGPVTILNWSFPREDIFLQECAFQIALAIRDEVLELEANGIKIIQIDEAALREKLPLRKSAWRSEYLDWAIPAFRLVHSGVKGETQIHTHMCYSEFSDIIRDIDDMDADVITFEASRSDLEIINVLNNSGFITKVGPGVYDIHSPRVPSKEEIKEALLKMLEKTPKEKLWVNPDCGLKTRGLAETIPSLKNLVVAAQEIRRSL